MINALVALALLLATQQGVGAPPNAPMRQITFRYSGAAALRSVTVAGEFNGWDKLKNPLERGPDGAWMATLPLAPGIYQYLFVLDGERWVNDPSNPRRDAANGNSVLVVAPADYDAQPGTPGDGLITGSAVAHTPGLPDVRRRSAARLSFTLRTRANDVQACTLLYNGRSRLIATAPMRRIQGDALYDFWRADAPAHGDIRYVFRLQDGATVRYLDGRPGLQPAPQCWFHVQADAFPKPDVPDWVRDAVFYQIFPDRFADGDKGNDPPGTEAWGAKPTWYNRMGGDLQGVLAHRDHLRALGINALYFNPLFTARSNHGYDTTDYHHVDPRFGGDAALKTLVQAAHRDGWHVMLDGVFNHTGVDFFAFKDLRERGADSPYKDWYFIYHFPIVTGDGQTSYLGWNSVWTLPKLNTANPATRRYLLDVGARWIREAHIDGWRLDAAEQVPHDFWRDFRRTVRQANPNAYVLGEIWFDSAAWLQGDQFDAVMNYRWRGAALDFFLFRKTRPSELVAALDRIRDDYPDEVGGALFNLLGSHDTERVRTLSGNRWERERQAVLFQMTYPGVPCIYYADEVGMAGGRDPDCRRCMPWNRSQWDLRTLAFYRQAIALRRNNALFRRGAYAPLAADDATGVFGFERSYRSQRAAVLFNTGDRPATVHLPAARWRAGRCRLWFGDGRLEASAGAPAVRLPAGGIAVVGSTP